MPAFLDSPAVAAARRSAADVLRRGATQSPGELTLRRLFVIGEVALAFVLLVSMALLGRTLLNVLAVSPGFDARGADLSAVAAICQLQHPRTRDRVLDASQHVGRAFRPQAVAIADEIPLTGDRGRRLVSVRPADAGRSRRANCESGLLRRHANSSFRPIVRAAG